MDKTSCFPDYRKKLQVMEELLFLKFGGKDPLSSASAHQQLAGATGRPGEIANRIYYQLAIY